MVEPPKGQTGCGANLDGPEGQNPAEPPLSDNFCFALLVLLTWRTDICAVPEELWLEASAHVDQRTAACVLPFVCRCAPGNHLTAKLSKQHLMLRVAVTWYGWL